MVIDSTLVNLLKCWAEYFSSANAFLLGERHHVSMDLGKAYNKNQRLCESHNFNHRQDSKQIPKKQHRMSTVCRVADKDGFVLYQKPQWPIFIVMGQWKSQQLLDVLHFILNDKLNIGMAKWSIFVWLKCWWKVNENLSNSWICMIVWVTIIYVDNDNMNIGVA